MRNVTGLMAVGLMLLGGCGMDEATAPEANSAVQSQESALYGNTGPLSVFVASNAATKNSVLAYRRGAGGALSPGGAFPTGGLGSGSGLGSQGAVTLSDDGRFLFVVNAGSNEISSFEVGRSVLVLRDIVPSGGDRPISVTVRGKLLYVLNAGQASAAPETAANITGFTVAEGQLTPIPSSTRQLSRLTPNVSPAQVGFSPHGKVIVVTEKATNLLTTYLVQPDGTTSMPMITPSHGPTPFGFAFDGRGTLIVSEAAGGARDASTVSSYRFASTGVPVPVSKSVPTTQSAACWVAVSRNSHYAYTTNTASGSISGLTIDKNGALELFSDGGVTATPGAGPIDLAFTTDGAYLYVLNANDQTLGVLRTQPDGTLASRPGIAGLPASTVGLAAR